MVQLLSMNRRSAASFFAGKRAKDSFPAAL
jgi:hypothetical protein